jgi:hypothetical protein
VVCHKTGSAAVLRACVSISASVFANEKSIHRLRMWELKCMRRTCEAQAHPFKCSMEGTTMNDSATSKTREVQRRQRLPLDTPSDIEALATHDIAGAMNAIRADTFAPYLKTKNFHWHMSGPHFRDYHLLLDEQATQLFAITDPIAERVRKLGESTLKSIGHIARAQRVTDNDAD